MHKVCENISFHCGGIQISGNPYFRIFYAVILAEFKRITWLVSWQMAFEALSKYGTILMKFKSPVEKDELWTLKLECSGARTDYDH